LKPARVTQLAKQIHGSPFLTDFLVSCSLTIWNKF